MFDTKIPLYGLMILMSLILNIVVIVKTYDNTKFTKEEIIGAITYEIVGIILGAKMLAFIENYHIYKDEFAFFKVGLSSYGGVIGAIIVLLIFKFQFKKNFKDLFLTFALPLPLLYAVGKIGCFLVGCCHGIEYHGFGNVVYNYVSNKDIIGLHLFPVQLIESIVFFAIFIYILIKYKQKKYDVKSFSTMLLLCGVSKFMLEFLRMSHIGKIISSTQTISLIFILLSIFLIIRNKKNRGIIKIGGSKNELL